MNKPRDIRFVAPTLGQVNVPGPVVLYEQTWQEHILPEHGDVDLSHVIEAITNPCYVHQSKTRPVDTVVFTSTNAVNHAGHPIWVPVRDIGDGKPFVTSAYYKGSTPGPMVWRKGSNV